MKRACIAIVDATRARIYTCDRTADPGGAHAAFVGALHEASDLVNPGGATGDHREGDHRESDHRESDRRFAHQVIDEIDRVAREQALDRVLLVATPAMLGELRRGFGALQRPELKLEYVAHDLARLTSPQIHDYLAQLRLVAAARERGAAMSDGTRTRALRAR
ncbi:MAG TPA: host attachment protein [Kofleriaceae bacterium]